MPAFLMGKAIAKSVRVAISFTKDREKNEIKVASANPWPLNGPTCPDRDLALTATAMPFAEMLQDEPLVQVDQVRKSFGDKIALHDVSFAIPAGRVCGLLGPNGAGKTTLFRLLMGILKASSGQLRVGGLDAFDDRVAVKRLIGFLPDEPFFYAYLSARELLRLSAGMHGLDVDETMDRLMPLAERLKLADDLDNYAEDFSRGMKKKLGLLLALLHQPRLLVLDEPTNGLDVESTRLFYDLIGAQAATGTTVLFSTHLMDQVARLCSHAVIINAGAVVDQGALPDLLERSGQPDLESLFLHLTSGPAV